MTGYIQPPLPRLCHWGKFVAHDFITHIRDGKKSHGLRCRLSQTISFSLFPRASCSNSFPAEISNLRSLVLLKNSNTPESSHNNTETLDLKIVPKSYKLLRLLTLQGIKTVNGSLPMEIGSLLHLRYLEIRGTNITKLPGSIGKLSCLLVLDYRDIVSEGSEPIIEIPNVLWKLVLLRHLFLPIDCQWNVEELMLNTLPNLQTLWEVKHDRAGHQWLSREIPKLSSSVKKLKIVVSNEDELQAAFNNPCIMSNRLQTFHCELQGGISLVNVEPLCHQRRLHKLILFGQVRMPLSLILPMNLIKLRLKDSVLRDEDPMTALGALSHLKLLILSNVFEGTKLVCKPGSFPQLEELYLENLIYLQAWNINKGSMPCLKKLEIRRCWCLEQFPQGLEFVTTLQQFVFYSVPDSFIKEAAQYGWSPPKLRLPSNFGTIISRADSPVDTSSIHELHELLSSGIFLDGKTQKYWVVEHGGIYINCFTVYGLNYGPGRQTPSLERWDTRLFVWEREIMEDELDLVTPIERPNVICHGKISSADLSLNVTYEIIWVVRSDMYCLTDDDDEVPFNMTVHTEFSCRDHEPPVKQHRVMFPEQRDGWVQISCGEFDTKPTVSKEIQVSIHYTQSHGNFVLLVKGFIIQPKS